jgi:hypothetical protein
MYKIEGVRAHSYQIPGDQKHNLDEFSSSLRAIESIKMVALRKFDGKNVFEVGPTP